MTEASEAWNPIDQPIDYVLLAGQRSPGLAELEGVDAPRKWDERRGYGLSGATVVFRGTGLTHFSLKLRLFEVQHWVDWEAWRPLVQRPPQGTRPRALDIWHPILEAQEIRSVVVENVLAPKQTGDGEWTVEIKLIEFRSPQFALAQPEGAAAAPTDPIDIRIDQNSAEIRRLSQEFAS